MTELNNFKNKDIYILRSEPSKIYSFSMLLFFTTSLLIILGNFIHYSKYRHYIASIMINDDTYLQTVISKEYFDNLNSSELFIEDEKYKFELIKFEQVNYDNNYNVVLKVNDIDLKNKKYVVFSLKQEKTTLFKEIHKRIKEELNSWKN